MGTDLARGWRARPVRSVIAQDLSISGPLR